LRILGKSPVAGSSDEWRMVGGRKVKGGGSEGRGRVRGDRRGAR